MKYYIHNQDEMLQVWKIKQWFDMYSPKVLSAEEIVFDFELNEAGTIDAVVEFPEDGYDFGGRSLTHMNGIYVVDFKTGKAVPDEAYCQIASYAHMYQNLHDVQVAGAIIIHTGGRVKKPIEGLKTIIIEKDELDSHFETHKLISQLWLRKNPGFAPKVFSFPEKLQFESSKGE